MLAKPDGLRPAALALTALLAAAAVAGCDPLSPRHDTMTVELDSETSTAVRLITSNEFSVFFDEDGREQFLLTDSDTVWVEVPYTAQFDLNETGRYFARAAESEDPEAVISMRVLLDGDQTFYREAVLTGDGIQYYYRTF